MLDTDNLRERVKQSIPEPDAGAGFSTRPGNEPHPAGPAKRGGLMQFVLKVAFATYFLLNVVAICFTQLMGAPLYFINKNYYYAYMAMTKQLFGIVCNTITQWFSPTIIRISGDKSVRGQLKLTKDGRLETNFPERLIMVANHQLYTEWLYLWWISYTSGMHGHIFIILKESLKYVPIIGTGMMFYDFIFLARNWAKDKPRFQHHITKLNSHHDGPLSGSGPLDPMWLLIFPEGTNLSTNGRRTSKAFAEKIGIEDMKHQLLPRTTGFQFCLQGLRKTVDWVYDCTIAYEGIPHGVYGQDVYTLQSTHFEGRPPKSVNMYWRRFAIKDIPMDDQREFEGWLFDRWREKDDLIEQYLQTGRFPADEGDDLMAKAEDSTEGKLGPGGYRYMETEVRSKSRYEFLVVFAPMAAYITVGCGLVFCWRMLRG